VRGALDAANESIREPGSHDEGLRLSSLRELVDFDGTLDTRFDSVVEMARDLFGVSGAGLDFVDSDCQVTYSGAGIAEEVIPREGTFGNVAISRDLILVVPDADRDPRFADHTNAAGANRVRFYAGYPIEAPNGQRIGALYIVDLAPREFTTEDASLLRQLVLRAQSMLWAAQPLARSHR